MRDYRPLFDHHDTILHRVRAIIAVFQLFRSAIDLHIIADIGVFIDNSVFDTATVADAHDRRITGMRFVYLVQSLVHVVAHHVAILDDRVMAYTGANTDHRAVDMTGIHDA